MKTRPLAIWTIALAICLAIRIGLGDTGELVCQFLLIAATSVRFGFGRRAKEHEKEEENAAAPIRSKGSDDEPSQTHAHEGPPLLPFIPRKGSDSIPPDAEPDAEDPSDLSPADNTIGKVPVPVPRLAYLDNVKAFLTALVVTFHVTLAFGGGGPHSWPLIVGQGRDGPFARFLGTVALLDQSFFMPLFFFISACFVPPSYERKGWRRFREDREKRILFPALFTLLLTTPACTAWGEYVAGAEVAYQPDPGVAWFLYWLLLFNWMYASTTSSGEAETEPSAPSARSERRNFPGTVPRLLCGTIICGLALVPFFVLRWGGSVFAQGRLAFMPVVTGSVTCDFLMFYLGVQAQKHGWLESSLSDQMDIHPALLALMVVAEGAGMALMLPMVMLIEKALMVVAEGAGMVLSLPMLIEINGIAGVGFLCLAGIFCLDMSLLVLVAFQRYLDRETLLTKFFARAAYGVYLLHPLVVTGMTALYIGICNQLGVVIEIRKEEGAPVGSEGDGQYLVGWIVVNLASHLFVWPLAWRLTRLPVLRNIL